MLDILRANARSALTYVLFGIIIVVFVVSFGPGSCGSTGTRGRDGAAITGEAAQVNGTAITLAEFEQHYGQLFRMYQQQAGEAFSRELADQLGLRRIALDQLVERELVRQEAARQGIVVSDAELERAVKEIPSFQTGGRFDYDHYQRVASSAYGSPARFEARLREDLAVQKLLALLRQTAKVSDDEVREAFLEAGDRVDLEFVRFPLSAARQVAKVSAAEVDAFAAANADRIRKAYDENKAAYDRPKRVKARHVLVKVDDAAGGAEDAARSKAEQILARARKGEDFAKLAKEASDDPGSKDRGGELGFFGPGVMAKPFEDAAFAMKPGDLGGPVRTRFGFHVIRVDEVQEAQAGSFEQARAQVARELLEAERAKQVARKKAEEALAAARGGKSLADLFPADEKAKNAVKWGGQALRAEQTGPFGAGAGGDVPRLGPAPELFAAAVAADRPKPLDRVFETPAGPVVARVTLRQKPNLAELESKKGELADRLRVRREQQLEQAWMKGLRESAEVKLNERLVASGPAQPQ